MRILFFTCLFFLIGCVTRYPLNQLEVDNLKTTPFNNLALTSSYEINGLRQDIIRQTYEDIDADGLPTTHNEPYHPLGFDLGNGLFYDLNDNLCFRIDQLYEIETQENYILKKTAFIKNSNRSFYQTKKANSICQKWMKNSRKVKAYCDKIEIEDNKLIRYNKKGKRTFEIVKTDNKVSFVRTKKRRRIPNYTIHKISDTEYDVTYKKKKKTFIVKDNTIEIKGKYSQYLIRNIDAANLIKVYEIGKNGNLLRYKIKRNNNQWFFYDGNYNGQKIVSNDNKLLFYKGEQYQFYYERIE